VLRSHQGNTSPSHVNVNVSTHTNYLIRLLKNTTSSAAG
jgi:hypothetical protein